MFSVITVLLGIIAILIGVYLFFTFKRTAEFCFKAKSEKFKTVTAIILACVFSLPLLFMFSGGSVWAVLLLHFVIFCLVANLVNFVVKRFAVGKLWDAVYRLCIIPLVLLCITACYGYYNMMNVIQTDYVVTTDKLEKGTQYKIAVISDVHYGTSNGEADIIKTVSDINSQNVDVVILCGDITDESTTKEQLYELYGVFGSLNAKYGVYYVYGNHDRAWYSKNPNFTEADIKDAVSKNGIRLLADEAVEITDDFVLVGRKDRSDKRLGMEALLSGVDKSDFILVADHQPTDFREKANAGADVQVSGHTHGGQIFPIGYINELISSNELCYGMEKTGNMTAIVSSGFSGWGFPLRTQPHSEYVIITVKA